MRDWTRRASDREAFVGTGEVAIDEIARVGAHVDRGPARAAITAADEDRGAEVRTGAVDHVAHAAHAANRLRPRIRNRCVGHREPVLTGIGRAIEELRAERACEAVLLVGEVDRPHVIGHAELQRPTRARVGGVEDLARAITDPASALVEEVEIVETRGGRRAGYGLPAFHGDRGRAEEKREKRQGAEPHVDLVGE